MMQYPKSCPFTLKIIFIGTSEFGAIILEKLIKAGISPVLVISAPDKLAGRKQILTPPPVKLAAQKYKIQIEQPEKVLSIKYKVLSIKPDLIVVAAYGQILPKEILVLPKYGCLNVHPSLLPRWRGASPVQYTILEGDEETGVTIILMDEKVDHGPILANRKWQIANRRLAFKELHNKLAELGGNLLVETIPKWLNNEIKPVPQDESKATYSKIIKKEDGRINWRKSADEIEKQIRAFNPWPSAYTFVKFQMPKSKLQIKSKIQNPKLLKILEANIMPCRDVKRTGEVFLTNDKGLAVRCGQNCLILQKLQVEGGKPMPADEFLRGRQDFIGATLS